MKTKEILENLCTNDSRNPDYRDMTEYDIKDSKSSDKDCACDNCHYGITPMALAFLKQRRAFKLACKTLELNDKDCAGAKSKDIEMYYMNVATLEIVK